MMDRNSPLLRRFMTLALCTSFTVGIVVGCSDSEVGSSPKISKSKRELFGLDDGKLDTKSKGRAKRP